PYFFQASAHHPTPPSFPTRRSSDLPRFRRSTHRENRAPSRPRNSIRLKNVDGPDRECWVRQTTVRVAAFENDTRLQRILCGRTEDRKSTRLNSSHVAISYAVFCLKK